MSLTLERPAGQVRDLASVLPAPRSARESDERWWRPSRLLKTEGGIVATVVFSAYLAAALLLAFVFEVLPLDAVSRMANGFYVLFSRDPHLAAVGFVWSPLQSVADIPFLLLKPVFPALATHDLAGSLVSVLAGVGAVHQVRSALREWGVARWPRLLLTVLFACNPMILYYAANGMSDMLYIFLLAGATRYLMQWMRGRGLRFLVYSGSILGLAYLDRYEAIGAAGLATAIVVGTTMLRSGGFRRQAVTTALADASVLLLPMVTTVAAWALASLTITGQLFPGITSQYGTGAQTSEAAPMPLASRLVHGAHNIEYLAPLVAVALVLAVFVSVQRNDPLVLVPLAVLGGSIAFNEAGLLVGFIEPWYRYFIVSVPLDVMLVGCVLSSSPRASGSRPTPPPVPAHDGPRLRSRKVAAGVALTALVLGPSIYTTAKGVFAASVQSSESTELGALFLAHPTKVERQWTHHLAHIRSIDAYFDAMHLPAGSVVADTYGNCTPQIVTSVSDSKIFVITSDRDFLRVSGNPLVFHAKYLLVPVPVGVGLVDHLNVEYPTLYATGAGFAELVHQFDSDGICAEYRLYRVTAQT